MANSQTSSDHVSKEPPIPKFSLKKLLGYVTGTCLLLALAATTLPGLLGPNWGSILLIVAFVVYPFATCIVAESICKAAKDSRFARRFATVLGAIGVIPAVLLNYPRPQIPMVAPIAGVVLVLCFVSTGAFIGALLDLRNRCDSNHD